MATDTYRHGQRDPDHSEPPPCCYKVKTKSLQMALEEAALMKKKRKQELQDLPGLIMLIGFAVVAVVFVSVFFYMAWRSGEQRDTRKGPLPPFLSTTAAAQPLPATLDPSRFQEPAVRRAYTMAKQKPAILAQQPCYCGCSSLGHQSLLDCFRDEHASGCSICVREAIRAAELDGQGKCAAEIRDDIVRTDWNRLEQSQ